MSAEPLTADAIFTRIFLPLYPPEQRADLRELVGARYTDATAVAGVDLRRELDGFAERFAMIAPNALASPALLLDFTDASVHRLGAAITRDARDRAMERGDLAPLVIHGAVYLGVTAARAHGATLRFRRPLWETLVTLESRAGRGDLAPFHWWLKALADSEIDEAGLTTRWIEHVERPRLDPMSLTPFLRVRTLPTLKLVRYDTLHKYLRAHVAELRDLGRDFPSPERFDELGFLSLDFMVLGEGRLLLMHGRGRAGLHLFWLDAAGFSHARCFSADPAVPHQITVEGDVLRLTFARDGSTFDETILYWG